MTKFIICNWKMNLGNQDSIEFLNQIEMKSLNNDHQFIICPPYTSLGLVANNLKSKESDWHLGAQNCSDQDKGARTGDISAAMLKDLGCDYTILGHSERRQYHQESNESVKGKALKVIAHGMIPIICVGETEEDYIQGKTIDVLTEQLSGSVPSNQCIVAYEPVWAIGTGKVPTIKEIETVHQSIDNVLQDLGFLNVPIVYGGSVKPDNINQILSKPTVSGVLIGGASIQPESMNAIIKEVCL